MFSPVALGMATVAALEDDSITLSGIDPVAVDLFSVVLGGMVDAVPMVTGESDPNSPATVFGHSTSDRHSTPWCAGPEAPPK